jgi:hypothetical protein
MLYTGLIAWTAASAAHVTRIEVLYPDIITTAYVLILALIVLAVAAFGNSGARRGA